MPNANQAIHKDFWVDKGRKDKSMQCKRVRYPLPKIAPSLLHPVRIFIIRYVWSDIHIHVNVLYAHLSYQHNPCVVSLVTVSIKTLDVSADHKYICIYIYIALPIIDGWYWCTYNV